MLFHVLSDILFHVLFRMLFYLFFMYYFIYFYQIRFRAYNMKTPVHMIVKMIKPYYDPLDESNTFDLGIQYLSNDMVTWPRVETDKGDGVDVPGFKSYLILKGLLPADFTGGSFTWNTTSKIDETDDFNQLK